MGHLTDKCVLIVEDEESFAGLLRLKFEIAGFRAVVCLQGAQVSAVLANQKFACVVIDQNLKGVSGAVMVERVKRNPVHINHATPFIYMSASPDPELLKKIVKDIEGAFVKPFNTNELIERVRALTAGKSA